MDIFRGGLLLYSFGSRQLMNSRII